MDLNNVTITISFNQMSGPIPLQLGNLSSLVELYLGGNYFNGTISSTMVVKIGIVRRIVGGRWDRGS